MAQPPFLTPDIHGPTALHHKLLSWPNFPSVQTILMTKPSLTQDSHMTHTWPSLKNDFFTNTG